MDDLLALAILLGALVVLDLAALRFGVSSRDGRRESWW
jgi:hypothetical protein